MAGGFLNRWSRRKAEKSIESPQIEQPSIAAPLNPQEIVIEPVPQPVPNPALASLEDVDKIDRMAPDFSAFMQAGVDPAVQQAALKKMSALNRIAALNKKTALNKMIALKKWLL